MGGLNEVRSLGSCIRYAGFFLDFIKRLVDVFPSFFNGDEDGDGERNEFTAEAQFNKKWGFYPIFYTLSKGDISRFKESTKLPLFAAFTFLDFERDKQKLERKK